MITQPFQPSKPVLTFYEDGQWIRIECDSVEDRYLPWKTGKALLEWIGQNSVSQKSDIIVV
jgi:hypothetical protein